MGDLFKLDYRGCKFIKADVWVVLIESQCTKKRK